MVLMKGSDMIRTLYRNINIFGMTLSEFRAARKREFNPAQPYNRAAPRAMTSNPEWGS